MPRMLGLRIAIRYSLFIDCNLNETFEHNISEILVQARIDVQLQQTKRQFQ